MTSTHTTEWIWISFDVALAIHEEQLASHGGLRGTRDEALLASALARPQNLLAYGAPDAFDLAAAYGFGIAKNHPFVDGNKRTSYVVTELFLALNGWCLTASDAECLLKWVALASGDVTAEQLGAWLRANCDAT